VTPRQFSHYRRLLDSSEREARRGREMVRRLGRVLAGARRGGRR